MNFLEGLLEMNIAYCVQPLEVVNVDMTYVFFVQRTCKCAGSLKDVGNRIPQRMICIWTVSETFLNHV